MKILHRLYQRNDEIKLRRKESIAKVFRKDIVTSQETNVKFNLENVKSILRDIFKV